MRWPEAIRDSIVAICVAAVLVAFFVQLPTCVGEIEKSDRVRAEIKAREKQPENAR